MEDSDRYYANTVLTNFVLSNIDSSLNDLFIIEYLIAKCYNRDEECTRIINDIDSTIANLIKEVGTNDSLEKYEERSLNVNAKMFSKKFSLQIQIIFQMVFIP